MVFFRLTKESTHISVVGYFPFLPTLLGAPHATNLLPLHWHFGNWRGGTPLGSFLFRNNMSTSVIKFIDRTSRTTPQKRKYNRHACEECRKRKVSEDMIPHVPLRP